MEVKDTKEYMNNVSHTINFIVEKVLLFLVFIGPALFIATKYGYLQISTSFCVLYSSIALGCTIIQHFLNGKYSEKFATSVFAMIALTIMIPLVMVQMGVEIHLLYCTTVFVSCLYMQVKLTRIIAIINYFVILISTFLFTLGGRDFTVFIKNDFQDFYMAALGISIEFLVLYFIAGAICRMLEKNAAERAILSTKYKQMEKESAAMSEFLTQMSHEIRTPINAVLGMNELILRESIDDTVREYSMTVHTAGKSLLNVVNDVLDYSKIESGKMEIINSKFDVAALLKEIIDVYSMQAKSKGLDFMYEVPECMPRYIYGDEIRMKQVVGNLLSNSVKYTDNGFICLKIEFKKSTEDKGRIVISVIDSGIGIRQEDIGKLFEKYGRLDLERNHTIQGTGLGLKICKQTVELMGGVLNVQSKYGEGSVFSIAIDQPIVGTEVIGDFDSIFEQLEAEVMDKVQKKELGTVSGAQILVVDDNEMNLKIAENLLRKTGADIDCLLSGKECIEEIQKKHYDLILLDHMMPEMDGIQVLNIIRNDKEHLCQNTKIAVLTANAISGARQQYLEQGFDDYISKPITIEALNLILKNNLQEFYANEIKTDVILSDSKSQDDMWDLSSYHIDTSKGREYMGDEDEQYLAMIRIFCDDFEKRMVKLGQTMDEQNMMDYAVLVHGLKGNARTLGADILGELAFEEEKAAKDGDIAFIEEHQYELCKEWRFVIDGFRTLLAKVDGEEVPEAVAPEEVEKKVVTREELEDQILMAMACLEGSQLSQAQATLQEILTWDVSQKIITNVLESLDAIKEQAYERAIDKLNRVWKGE